MISFNRINFIGKVLVDEVAIPTTLFSNANIRGCSKPGALDIPRANVRINLHTILKLYSYKTHFVQKLKSQTHSVDFDFANISGGNKNEWAWPITHLMDRRDSSLIKRCYECT